MSGCGQADPVACEARGRRFASGMSVGVEALVIRSAPAGGVEPTSRRARRPARRQGSSAGGLEEQRFPLLLPMRLSRERRSGEDDLERVLGRAEEDAVVMPAHDIRGGRSALPASRASSDARPSWLSIRAVAPRPTRPSIVGAVAEQPVADRSARRSGSRASGRKRRHRRFDDACHLVAAEAMQHRAGGRATATTGVTRKSLTGMQNRVEQPDDADARRHRRPSPTSSAASRRAVARDVGVVGLGLAAGEADLAAVVRRHASARSVRTTRASPPHRGQSRAQARPAGRAGPTGGGVRGRAHAASADEDRASGLGRAPGSGSGRTARRSTTSSNARRVAPS